MRAPSPFIWRGIRFDVASWSAHSGAVRYESRGTPLWELNRHDTGGPWHARLRINPEVAFISEGTSKVGALNSAYTKVERLQSILEAALEEVSDQDLTPGS